MRTGTPVYPCVLPTPAVRAAPEKIPPFATGNGRATAASRHGPSSAIPDFPAEACVVELMKAQAPPEQAGPSPQERRGRTFPPGDRWGRYLGVGNRNRAPERPRHQRSALCQSLGRTPRRRPELRVEDRAGPSKAPGASRAIDSPLFQATAHKPPQSQITSVVQYIYLAIETQMTRSNFRPMPEASAPLNLLDNCLYFVDKCPLVFKSYPLENGTLEDGSCRSWRALAPLPS